MGSEKMNETSMPPDVVQARNESQQRIAIVRHDGDLHLCKRVRMARRTPPPAEFRVTRERLDAAMARAKIKNQRRLALLLHVHPSQPKRWSEGEPISMDNFVNLCLTLGVGWGELLGLDEDPRYAQVRRAEVESAYGASAVTLLDALAHLPEPERRDVAQRALGWVDKATTPASTPAVEKPTAPPAPAAPVEDVVLSGPKGAVHSIRKDVFDDLVRQGLIASVEDGRARSRR